MTYDVLPATDEVRAMVANRKRNRAHNPTKVSSWTNSLRTDSGQW